MVSLIKFLRIKLKYSRKLIALVCIVIFTFVFGQNCSPPKLGNNILSSLKKVSSGYDRFFINSNFVQSFSTSAVASILISVQSSIESVDSVGFFIDASYVQGACANKSVKVDMYLLDSAGVPQFQNQCFTNPYLSSSFPKKTYCYFRQPLAAGSDASKILLRYWKISDDCSNFADDVGIISNGFQDQFLNGSVSPAKFYQGFC